MRGLAVAVLAPGPLLGVAALLSGDATILALTGRVARGALELSAPLALAALRSRA